MDHIDAALLSAGDAVTVYPAHDALSEALAALRPLSNRELARLAGVDHRTIGRIRRGAQPRRALAARLLFLAADETLRVPHTATGNRARLSRRSAVPSRQK
jgi:transcriptional regulator with XRE-family HTH domain